MARDAIPDTENGRRASDSLRIWFPIVVVLVGWLVSAGVFYGALGGRLNLIEYRLQQIEQRLP